MTLPIDKNVPIPESMAGRIAKYPLSEMEVGDSFFSAGTAPAGISSAISYFLKRHKGRKFTRRSVTEGGVNGVRVWRIS